MAASRGSASNCISSRASTSRCQGLTPRELHPDTASVPAIVHKRLNRPRYIDPPSCKCLFFGQQFTQLRFEDRGIHWPKSDVSEARYAMAIDQHTGGHAFDSVELGRLSFRIEAHVKRRFELIQKFVRIEAVSIQIDGDYREALPFVGLGHTLHPGKRLSARTAP